MFRRAGDHVGEVWSLNSLGYLHRQLGQPGRAAVRYRQALALLPDTESRYAAAIALNGLGKAGRVMGRSSRGPRPSPRRLGRRHHRRRSDETAYAHTGLGDGYLAIGDIARAREHYQQALTLYVSLGTPQADRVRARIAAIQAGVDKRPG